METVGGDDSETRLVTKKKGENRQPVSVPASPGLEGLRGEQQQLTIGLLMFGTGMLVFWKGHSF